MYLFFNYVGEAEPRLTLQSLVFVYIHVNVSVYSQGCPLSFPT